MICNAKLVYTSINKKKERKRIKEKEKKGVGVGGEGGEEGLKIIKKTETLFVLDRCSQSTTKQGLKNI